MDTAVLMEIENLRRATLAALREKFREVFQEETRSRHREHLFRRIAWRLQALAEGDLSERARGRAQRDRAGCRLANSRAAGFLPGGRRARPNDAERTGIAGNRIAVCRCRAWCSAGSGKDERFWSRSWQKGFRYENRHYSSLSAIAVAITGTRWNGLAFFGLTRPAGGKRKEQPHAEK